MFNLNDYLKNNRGSDRATWLAKPIECKDGFTISVQASEYNYCNPRCTDSNYYYEVECGFPSSEPEFIMDYAEDPDTPTKTVYAYVPVELVEQLIDLHNK